MDRASGPFCPDRFASARADLLSARYVTKLPHGDQNCSLQNDALGPAQLGLNSEGEGVIQVAEGCEMIGNLAEPNLTKRLDLLAEARRNDPRLRQHLMEAKAEIERLQAALLGIVKIPREPPAAHFMRDIANAALRPAELRDATG